MMKYDEMNPAQKMTADRMKNAYPMDERTMQVNEKRLALCGVIAIFYVVVRVIYVGFHGELAVPELVLLFLMVAAMTLIDRKNDVHSLPQFMGRTLDPKPSARGKRIGQYLLGAMLLAASWTAMDYFGAFVGWNEPVKGALVDFGISTVIFFLFDLILGEYKVRKYNSYMAKMEAEENNLDD